jgi:filamentous hemagglutinin family protein
MFRDLTVMLGETLHNPILKTYYLTMRTAFSLRLITVFTLISWPASSQVIPDGSLGTTVESAGHRFEIEGGQLSSDGANLFHSFNEFGLGTNQIANFVTTSEIQNVLGRVTGGDASLIDGMLQVTGSGADLFLMNPAGIVFGENARLDVAGDFTATAAGAIGFESGWFEAISGANWSDLVGDPVAFDFSGFSGENASAIVNFGELSVNSGSNLNLFGGTVINSGSLSGGNVSVTAISGGNTLQLSAAGNVLGLEVATNRVAGEGIAPITLPELLTGGNLSSARSLEIVSGVVTLSGAAIEAGDSVVTGAIDVSSDDIGGVVQVLGDRVFMVGANIDATGVLGGGAIYLGGEYRGGGTLPTAEFTVVDGGSRLDASAIESGDGGEVIIWAEETAGFFGEIVARGGELSGDGGFVETSGKRSLVFRGGVDVGADNGLAGSILLDPENITIADLLSETVGDNETINVSILEALTGNITLEATNDIVVAVDLQFSGGGEAISFIADSDSSGGGTFFSNGYSISTSGSSLNIEANQVNTGEIDTGGGVLLISSEQDYISSGTINTYGGAITFNSGGTLSLSDLNSQGGDITLDSGGTLEAGYISSGSYGYGAGAITLNSGGALSVGNLSSYGGDITLDSGSDLEVGNITTRSYQQPGGNISLYSQGNISTGNLNSFSYKESGGSIEISNYGDGFISIEDVNSSSTDSTGGSISIFSDGGESVRVGSINTLSYFGLGGEVTIFNGGSVNVSSINPDVLFYDSPGGVVILESTESSIEVGSIVAPWANITANDQLNLGNVYIFVVESMPNPNRNDISFESTGNLSFDDLSVVFSSILSDKLQSADINILSGGSIDSGSINITSYSLVNGDQTLSVTAPGDISIGELRRDLSGGLFDADVVIQSESGGVEVGDISMSTDLSSNELVIDSLQSMEIGSVSLESRRANSNVSVNLVSRAGGVSAETISTATERGNGGSVMIQSELDVTFQDISTAVRVVDDVYFSEPNGDNFGYAGNIIITSNSGNVIGTGILDSYSDNHNAVAGFVTVMADGSIALGGVNSAGIYQGGNLTLRSNSGQIQAGNINTESELGVAGNVNLNSATSATLGSVTSYGVESSGDLTIFSAGDITSSNVITQANSGQSGNIFINSQDSIASGNIRSIGVTGSGNITIDADRNIVTENITTTTQTGNSGNVTVTATGNVTTGNIESSTGGDGDSGDITANSETGSINSGDITTESAGGNSGNVNFSALIDVILGNLTSSGGQNSGDINLNAGRDVTTGDITSIAQNGDSGDISINAGRDITTGDIASIADNGTSGNIDLDAGRNIDTGNITTQDGNITLDAGGEINTGELTSDNDILIDGEISGLEDEITEIATLDNEALAQVLQLEAVNLIQTDSSLNPNIISGTINSTSTIADSRNTNNSADNLTLDFNGLGNLPTGLLTFADTNLIDIATLDSERSGEYTSRFGDDGTLGGSIAATRKAMARIEAETGIRTGAFYVVLRDDAIDIALLTAEGAPIATTVNVDRTTLLNTVEQYRYNLINSRMWRTGRYNDYAAQLYDWLIRPIVADLETLEVDTLMFSMDAGLRGLPMAALYDGEQYLIENYSLSLIPSIGLIDTRYQPIDERAPMLAMGASEFTNLAALPAVPAELSALVNYRRRGQILLNEDFTRRNLVAERDRTPYPIVHLATHGEFSAGDPSNSYIQLWDERIGLDNIRELGWHDPAVELLVLSACQTALGNNEAEMGFAGLAVAAGVKTAIASLWYVDDAATFRLMTELYNYLAIAPIKAEALRMAQLALINGNARVENGLLYTSEESEPIPLPDSLINLADRDFSHPYYWSAFTAIGAPW